MAREQRSRPSNFGNIEDYWTCTLSASPANARNTDDVTFRVVLSNRGVTEIFGNPGGAVDTIPRLPREQVSAFYNLFNYVYDPGDSLLTIPASNPAVVLDQESPKGSYPIIVAIQAQDPTGLGIEHWFENNASLAPSKSVQWNSLRSALLAALAPGGVGLGDRADFNSITDVIETESKVTL